MINSLFRSSFMISNSWFQLFIFLSGAPSYFNYIISKLHLNHCKASPGVLFNFPFRLIILLLSEFFMEALHDGSSRIPFILVLFFRIFFKKLRSTKLYSELNMVLNTCFVLRSSTILLLAFRSSILSTLSFEVVLYHSWQFPFMFRDSHIVKNEVF